VGTSKSVVLMLRHSTPGQGRIMRYAGPRQPELLEPRTMLSADPIEFGAVYVEQDLGSDAHADTIEITFEGGAPNTQLSWVEIFGDKLTPGLSFADMIFDTRSTGLGVDLAHDGLIADYEGDFEAIEAEMGRERGERWSARTLDLDLLFAGDAVLPDPGTQDAWRALPPEEQARQAPGRLILPHPRLQDRGFVLVPLAEICPGWTHPRTGQTVRQMLEALPDPEREAIHAL